MQLNTVASCVLGMRTKHSSLIGMGLRESEGVGDGGEI